MLRASGRSAVPRLLLTGRARGDIPNPGAADGRAPSSVPVVVVKRRDLRPWPRHHVPVCPCSDKQMKADLHDKIRDKEVCAPAATGDGSQAADDEGWHVERADNSPEPKMRRYRRPSIESHRSLGQGTPGVVAANR